MFDLGKWQGKNGFINELLFIIINMLEGSDIYIKITLFLKLLSLDFYINYDECFVAFNCQVLVDVLFGNFMFLLTFFFMIKIFFHVSITISRYIFFIYLPYLVMKKGQLVIQEKVKICLLF